MLKTRFILIIAGALCGVLLAGSTASAQTVEQQPTPEQDLQFWEELAFWEAVKNSTNPAELQAYIDAYPDGRFVNLARVRILSLQPAQPEQPTGSVEPAAAVEPAAGAEPAPPTAGSAPLKSSLYTARTNSNVRAAPTTNAGRIGGITQGQTVLVIGEVAGGDWYRVQLDDGRIGYVYASLLDPQQDAAPNAAAAPGGAGLAVGDVFRDCPECPAMTVVPAGQFEMGSEQRSDEQPRRQVTIPQPFAVGVFEVSVEQWSVCVNAGGCRYRPEDQNDPRHPISNISWDDAQEYVAWLSEKTGYRYRLLSEAEWEYAARAGSSARYWWGDQVGSGLANCSNCGSRWDDQQTAPTGSFKANPFGLYDVHGNVWEWVADCYDRSYQGAPDDGSARGQPSCLTRVLRGGSWKQDASYMRSARRNKYDRDVRYFLNGLRIARDL